MLSLITEFKSPARLLNLSTRPQKPIHLSSVIPRSHRPQLSVRYSSPVISVMHLLKLLALPHQFGNTLPLEIRNVNLFLFNIIARAKVFCQIILPEVMANGYGTDQMAIHGKNTDLNLPGPSGKDPPGGPGCHHRFCNNTPRFPHSRSRNTW